MTFSYIVWNRLPPEIPLYYGLPNGTGQIAEKSRIIVPSTAAVSFIVLNTIITVIVNNQFLKKLLVITGFVLSIFALTTTLEIIFLVGNI